MKNCDYCCASLGCKGCPDAAKYWDAVEKEEKEDWYNV